MQKVSSPDSNLADQIQRGESTAEATLYEKYSARVYYLALSELRSREDAEDVRTETFMRVIQAIRNGSLRSPEFQLKGYFVYRFYKLAFNRLPTYLEVVTAMRCDRANADRSVSEERCFHEYFCTAVGVY